MRSLATILLFCFAACSSTEEVEEAKAPQKTEESEVTERGLKLKAKKRKKPKKSSNQKTIVVSLYGPGETWGPQKTMLEISGGSLGQFAGLAHVISGPGYDIERIEAYRPGGQRSDNTGYSNEHPLVFELSGSEAAAMTRTFDEYFKKWKGEPNVTFSAAIIVRNVAGQEQFRWNAWELVPAQNPEKRPNGRTRFMMRNKNGPNNVPEWKFDDKDPFGKEGANNPTKDTLTEIDGALKHANFCPVVSVDTQKLTVTLTWDYAEGNGIYDWVLQTIQGLVDKRSMSIIQRNVAGQETSRTNYYECVPIRYEQMNYDIAANAKARVVIAYGTSELAK